MKDAIAGYKPFDRYNPILSYDHQLYASKYWEPNVTGKMVVCTDMCQLSLALNHDLVVLTLHFINIFIPAF